MVAHDEVVGSVGPASAGLSHEVLQLTHLIREVETPLRVLVEDRDRIEVTDVTIPDDDVGLEVIQEGSHSVPGRDVMEWVVKVRDNCNALTVRGLRNNLPDETNWGHGGQGKGVPLVPTIAPFLPATNTVDLVPVVGIELAATDLTELDDSYFVSRHLLVLQSFEALSEAKVSLASLTSIPYPTCLTQGFLPVELLLPKGIYRSSLYLSTRQDYPSVAPGVQLLDISMHGVILSD
jgi:hypothetical protein